MNTHAKLHRRISSIRSQAKPARPIRTGLPSSLSHSDTQEKGEGLNVAPGMIIFHGTVVVA